MDKSGRLDLDTNEVNGTANRDSVEATYKKLSEDDTNRQSKNEKISDTNMVKQNGTDADVEDEAQERMLQDDVKISPKKDVSEVKFISENGDAKIDIGTVKQVLSGMGKEELMKFANDPFWIRLRWFLFIAFWLLWIAMLAGAVTIILMAPKCYPPAPKKWWQESPIVQLEETDTPSRNLKGLETLLDSIKEQNIKIISLASIVQKDNDGQTINFRGIQSHLGSIDDFKSFINTANSKGLHVILELDPNHTSVNHTWFQDSVKGVNNRTSYYVWENANVEKGVKKPPNNWLSVYGGSAWEWNKDREQYYLHQFNRTQPDLNYNNSAVVAEFGEILSYWLSLGVKGFRLENTQFLTEDLSQDHTKSNEKNVGGVPDSYISLNHVKTKERVENGAILKQWRNIVMNKTNGEGLFMLRDDISPNVLQVFNDKETGEILIDLPQNSQFLTADTEISATNLTKSILQTLKICDWPAWNINGKKRPLRSKMPADVADSLILMTLLLPGTPIYKYSDIISAKAAFAKISEKRTVPAFLFGETKIYNVSNTDVFAYTRIKSGNPGYLVAYNSGNQISKIDISTIPRMAKEVTVIAYSPNFAAHGINTSVEKLYSKEVTMAPKSTIVLSFALEAEK